MVNKKKLDMTIPENRYALIVDYFEKNPSRLLAGNNHSYLTGVMNAGEDLVTDRFRERLEDMDPKKLCSMTLNEMFALVEAVRTESRGKIKCS